MKKATLVILAALTTGCATVELDSLRFPVGKASEEAWKDTYECQSRHGFATSIYYVCMQSKGYVRTPPNKKTSNNSYITHGFQ
jgi:hypothetical protein